MEKEKNVLLLLTLSSKKCPCCGEVKPTTEFTRQKGQNGKWGFHSHCKKCKSKRTMKYHLNNPEKHKITVIKQKLKKLYGLTIEDIEGMLKNQNYKCAICGREIFLHGSSVDKNKIARVDHNHETGKVRGLLCDDCNIGLGKFMDNTEYLLGAISYLNKNT